MGIKTFNITKKTGPVAAADVIDDSKEVYVVSAKAQVLRTSLSEIRSTGRATQGVTIFKPQPGDAVVSISCVGEMNVPEEDTENKASSTFPKPSPKGVTNSNSRNGNMLPPRLL